MSSREPNQYTAEFLIRYHKGELSAAEMHQLEKDAMEDPFLYDALDGYAHADEGLNLTDVKLNINETLPKTISHAKTIRKWFSPLSLAASLFLLFMVAYFILKEANTDINTATASATSISQPTQHADSLSAVATVPVEGNTVDFTEQDAKDLATVLKQDHPKTTPGIISKSTIASRVEKTNPAFKPANGTEPALRTEINSKEILDEVVNTETAFNEKELDNVKSETKSAVALNGYSTHDETRQKNMADIKASVKSADSLFSSSAATASTTTKMKLPAPVMNISNNNSWSGNAALNEVVVTGVGSRKAKRASMAAFSKVEAKQLADSEERDDAKSEKPSPAPQNGWEAFYLFVKNNKQTCHTKDGKDFHGFFKLSFYINGSGLPYQIKAKSLSEECLKELKRLLNAGPKWTGDTSQKVELQLNW